VPPARLAALRALVRQLVAGSSRCLFRLDWRAIWMAATATDALPCHTSYGRSITIHRPAARSGIGL